MSNGFKEISSISNPAVNYAIKLRQKKKFAKLEQMVFVEGQRECERALECEWQAEYFYICEELMSFEEKQKWFKVFGASSDTKVMSLTQKVYERVAVRGDSQGIVGIFKDKSRAQPPEGAQNIIALFNIEKPGNLGAIARSADAIGVDGIILIDCAIHEFHHHAVRASIGAIFSTPITKMTAIDFIQYCNDQGIRILLATGFAKNEISELKWQDKQAIVLGSEAFGLDEFEKMGEFDRFKIPMNGVGDSLNVSVAAAISMYEMMRQKK